MFNQIGRVVISFFAELRKFVFGAPILLLFHIHGDMGPNIDVRMRKTADNGGQTVFDYNIALVAALAGYKVIVLNYGKYRGPGIKIKKMTVPRKDRSFFLRFFPDPIITFVYVAAENFGHFTPDDDLFNRVASLLILKRCQKKQQFMFVLRMYIVVAEKYDDGVAKEKLWPLLPSIAKQFAAWLYRENLVKRLGQGKSLIYGGYPDASYAAVLVKSLLGLDEKVLPVAYVTHSVAIGQTGKASVVLKPFLESRSINNQVFLDKIEECAFYPRLIVERLALLFMTTVAATSTEHFSNMPYVAKNIRKLFAVPGVNQEKGMSWGEHINKNPGLKKYSHLSPQEAAAQFLADEGLPTDNHIIYFPARLQEVKNFHGAIEAMRYLDQRFCLFITAGPQPSGRDLKEREYWDRLCSLAQKYNVSVIIRPGTSKINEYFAAIAAAPYRGVGLSIPLFEPFGMVPQDAIINNCPVIVSTVAGCVTSGYFSDGNTAVVADPLDPKGVAKSVFLLCCDEKGGDLYAKLQVNAMKLARQTTWENTFLQAVRSVEDVRNLVRSGKLLPVEEEYFQEHQRILALAGFVEGEKLLPPSEWKKNPEIINGIPSFVCDVSRS